VVFVTLVAFVPARQPSTRLASDEVHTKRATETRAATLRHKDHEEHKDHQQD